MAAAALDAAALSITAFIAEKSLVRDFVLEASMREVIFLCIAGKHSWEPFMGMLQTGPAPAVPRFQNCM